jgi:hypothetical protein
VKKREMERKRREKEEKGGEKGGGDSLADIHNPSRIPGRY